MCWPFQNCSIVSVLYFHNNGHCYYRITIYQTSISPTFYKHLFHTKVLCTVFLYLHFVLVFWGQKEVGVNAASKMLVKLIPASISLTFYEQLLCTNVFCTSLMCLQLGFVIYKGNWYKSCF